MTAVDPGRRIDQYKRLQTKLPLDFEAIREARRQAQEPPDWLAEWPDDPPVPMLAPPPAESLPVGTMRSDRCVLCPEPVALGDRVACRVHQAEIAATAALMPELQPRQPQMHQAPPAISGGAE
jgi:hypothetical protein